MTPLLALRMRAYRKARYHDDRLAHYERLNRWSNFTVVIASSGAMAGFVAFLTSAKADTAATVSAGISAAISMFVGAGQLAFDYSAKARAHSELKRSFAKIMAKAEDAACDVETLNREMVELYSDEFEVFNAVNALAYNAAQDAFDRPADIYRLDWWQIKLRHIVHFDLSDFTVEKRPFASRA